MYGIFNEEGMIEGDFYTADEANQRIVELLIELGDDDETFQVKEVCPQHDDQPKDGCEVCDEEDEDNDDDEEEDEEEDEDDA